MRIIGVDPGGRSTGLVRLDGPDLDVFGTVTRKDAWGVGEYLHAVLTEIDDLHADYIAIETVVAPNPHMGVISVVGVLETAQVFGAVLGRWPDAIPIPPGKNGSHPLQTYPEALRPTRGNGKGKDSLRHVRSAYDVAKTGTMLALHPELCVK